ncbi:MAG: glucosamine inositolphosphorylceramide transferase family protein, partial [Achromobacter pestifer]
MKTYRVGLLVDGYEQPGWMHEMVDWLIHSQDFGLSALLVMSAESTGKAPRLGVKAFFGTLSRFEARLLPAKQRQMLAACRDMRQSMPPGLPVLALAPGQPGDGGEDVVAALGLDLVITLGASSATRSQMMGWARLGVWQLSYSDIAVSTSRYAGFWEVYQREDHTTVKLWRVGPEADQDELLDQRSFNTELFWLKNQARAFSLGNFMLYDALQALARAQQAVAAPEMQIMSGPRRTDPVEWDSAAYIARQAWLISDLIVRRIMKRNVRWRIGMFPSSRQQAVISDAMVLQPPKGRFFADPFVYTHEKKPYIFFEDYDFTSRKGTISVATYSDGAFRLLGTALNLPYHLSFPYIFE